MNDYFVMWEVAQEWETATAGLRDSLHVALGRVETAVARHERLKGLGIVLIYLAALLLWMML